MNLNKNSDIALLGVASDLGGPVGGARLGPSAIRYAHVQEKIEDLGYHVIDEGDLYSEKLLRPITSKSNLKFLDEIADLNQRSYEKVSSIIEEGRFPLILGGDHSMAIGTIAGVRDHYQNLGVIWIDAHGDINTQDSSPTGNIHGMPVAVNMGYGHEKLTAIGGERKLDPAKFVYIAARDLDEGEREIIKKLGIATFTMHDVDEQGMPAIIEQAIEIASSGTDGVHLSFDVDSIDPKIVQGTGTKVDNGLTVREARFALEKLYESEKIVSAEFVETNPLLDLYNQTAEITVSLIESLLGKTLI